MDRRNFLGSSLSSLFFLLFSGSSMVGSVKKCGAAPATTNELSPIPVKHKGVRESHINNCLVLKKRASVIKLNDPGRLIWESIDGERSSHHLVDIVLDNFSVSRKEVTEDVDHFIKSLLHEGFITIQGRSKCYKV